MNWSRIVSPVTNPSGYIAAAGAVYAAVTMIYNALNHHGVINVSVIVAAVAAVLAAMTRHITTPVADPHNAAGQPLVPAAPTPAPAPPPG